MTIEKSHTRQRTRDTISAHPRPQEKLGIFEKLARWRLIKRALRQREKRIEPRRIDPWKFEGRIRNPDHPEAKRVFEKSDIKNDMKALAERRARFAAEDATLPKQERKGVEQAKQLADILEAVLSDRALEIFGPSDVRPELKNKRLEVIVPSEYDDIMRGTDLMLVFRESPLRGDMSKGAVRARIALDITYATGETVDNKMIRNLQGIASENERLSSLKYFTDGNEHRTLNGIPRVLVGVDRSHVLELGQLWVNQEKLALANHPVARSVIMQIHEQLRAQHMVAVAHGKQKAAAEIERTLQVFEQLRREASNLSLSSANFAMGDDKVYGAIMERTKPQKMNEFYMEAEKREGVWRAAQQSKKPEKPSRSWRSRRRRDKGKE